MKFLSGKYFVLVFAIFIVILSLSIENSWSISTPLVTFVFLIVLCLLNYLGVFTSLLKFFNKTK